MEQHDPYGPMLAELRCANDCDSEEGFQTKLEQAQPYVTDLRLAYKKSPSNVDFSCPHTRAAYLLAYYPNYIEPLYYTLSCLQSNVIENVFSGEKVRGLFLGAGPAPEVLGWIAFLNDYAPNARIAIANILDKYIHGWRVGQEITRYHLAERYWPRGKTIIRPMDFDFLSPDPDPNTIENLFFHDAVENSNLIVMQNCINDQLGDSETISNFLKYLFTNMSTGSLLVLIDIKYPSIRDFIRQLGTEISDDGMGDVLIPVQNHPIALRAKFDIPDIILENLLIGDKTRNLIPKKNTGIYYSAILRLANPNDDIPF